MGLIRSESIFRDLRFAGNITRCNTPPRYWSMTSTNARRTAVLKHYCPPICGQHQASVVLLSLSRPLQKPPRVVRRNVL